MTARESLQGRYVPEERLTPQFGELPIERGGVHLDDHVLFGAVTPAQSRCPILVRHDNRRFVGRERQFNAGHPPLALPGPVDDLLRSRLVAHVAPAQFFWQNAEIALGLIDYSLPPRSKIQDFWNISPNWEYRVNGNLLTKASTNASIGASVKLTQR